MFLKISFFHLFKVSRFSCTHVCYCENGKDTKKEDFLLFKKGIFFQTQLLWLSGLRECGEMNV